MARRSPETLADYLVVAISPALIMLLVGSLVFFLIEVFYQGQYEGRLLFVMAMFVMAIVCVARIAMEEGAGYASLFGVPLALVTALALARFVEVRGPMAAFGPLVNWGLMALIWWSAHKLTWDCTLIDDSQDASGHGLLQELGFDRPAGSSGVAPRGLLAGTSTPAQPVGAGSPEATTGQSQAALPWWQTILEADRRPHAPGLWVVYFSLAALPLFGVGGWFIPASAADVRQRAFLFLVVYVAAGLTLLLSTSFLGLRRYLRQRKLEMPVEMTVTWVGVGLILIAATLLVCALLPRPEGVWEQAKLPIEFTSPDNRANRIAAGPEGAQEVPQRPSSSTAQAQKGQQSEREGPGKPQPGKSGSQQSDSSSNSGNQQGEKGKPGSDAGKPSEQGKSGGQNGNNKQSQGQGDSQGNSQSQGGDKPDESKQGQGAKGGKSGSSGKSGEQSSSNSQNAHGQNSSQSEQQPNKPDSQTQSKPSSTASNPPPSQPPPSPPPASSIRISSFGGAFAWILRALFYLFLLVVVIVLAYLYREQLAAAWKKLLVELRELWERWFGKKLAPALAAAETAPAAPQPFAAFSDPFATGAAGRMSWAELVRYTFQAMEAFGRERGCPRATGQTPHEYALALSQPFPQLGRFAAALADWYGQLAYASRAAAPAAVDPLKQLWQGMRSA
jgi:hypothetical protein